MTRFPGPLNAGQLQRVAEWLLEWVRLEGLLPQAALVVMANALGLDVGVQESAWRRARRFGRATFGDAFIAELILHGKGLTIFQKKILGAFGFRPHRAISPAELDELLDSSGRSLRGVSRLLSCDRATVRRHLRAAA